MANGRILAARPRCEHTGIALQLEQPSLQNLQGLQAASKEISQSLRSHQYAASMGTSLETQWRLSNLWLLAYLYCPDEGPPSSSCPSASGDGPDPAATKSQQRPSPSQFAKQQSREDALTALEQVYRPSCKLANACSMFRALYVVLNCMS